MQWTQCLIETIRNKNIKSKNLFMQPLQLVMVIKNQTSEKILKINIQHPYVISKYIGEQAIMHWEKNIKYQPFQYVF